MRPLPLPTIIPASGVSFRQAQLRDVVEGDRVRIVAADDNPHDPHACEIRGPGDVMLGFVPAALAQRLRLSGEHSWQGEIVDVLRGETWGLRIRVLPPGTDLAATPRERRSQAIERGRRRASGEAAPGRDLDAPTVVGRKRVRAMSGRDLGVLCRMDGDRVVVEADGVEVTYPATLVTLEG